MQHLHIKECASTQTLLKDNFVDLSQPILVSTDFQNQGIGRRGSPWSHLEHALAFSFTLPLNRTLTLTPIEIGCLLADYFAPNLFMKWPNDLLNIKKEKVGGILCQLVGENLVVGVGLNLFVTGSAHFDYPIGGIFENSQNLNNNFKEDLPLELYKYIRKSRVEPEAVQHKFKKYCSHLGQRVSIIDHQREDLGRFIGISSLGEALLSLDDEDNSVLKILTGSLRF